MVSVLRWGSFRVQSARASACVGGGGSWSKAEGLEGQSRRIVVHERGAHSRLNRGHTHTEAKAKESPRARRTANRMKPPSHFQPKIRMSDAGRRSSTNASRRPTARVGGNLARGNRASATSTATDADSDGTTDQASTGVSHRPPHRPANDSAPASEAPQVASASTASSTTSRPSAPLRSRQATTSQTDEPRPPRAVTSDPVVGSEGAARAAAPASAASTRRSSATRDATSTQRTSGATSASAQAAAPAPAASSAAAPSAADDAEERDDEDAARREAARMERLQLVLAMRRHELILELLDMASAQVHGASDEKMHAAHALFICACRPPSNHLTSPSRDMARGARVACVAGDCAATTGAGGRGDARNSHRPLARPRAFHLIKRRGRGRQLQRKRHNDQWQRRPRRCKGPIDGAD